MITDDEATPTSPGKVVSHPVVGWWWAFWVICAASLAALIYAGVLP